MATSEVALVRELVGDHYGELVGTMAECLLSKGRQTLPSIVKNTGLKSKHVQAGIFVLIQQRLVKWDMDVSMRGPVKASIMYTLDVPRVHLRLFYPRFLAAAESLFSADHASVIRLLLLHGSLSTEVLLAEAEHLKLSKQRTNEIIESLAAQHYIERLNSKGAPKEKDYGADASKTKKRRVEPSAPPSSVASAPPSASIPAGEVPWVVSTDRFLNHLAMAAIISFAKEKVGPFAGDVLGCVVQLGDKQITAEGFFSPGKMTASVTHHQLVQALRHRWTSPDPLESTLDVYLELLTHDAAGFLSRIDDIGGGTYAINTERVLATLQQAQVESIVLEKFGAASRRMFRILLDKKFLEQKTVAQMAMVAVNEARSKLYTMMSAGFLSLQEIPKTPDRAVSRTFFLFRASLDDAVMQCTRECIGTICKLRQRLLVETNEQDLDVLDKMSHTTSPAEALRIHKVAARMEVAEERVITTLLSLRRFR